jgi:hypothetical protein
MEKDIKSLLDDISDYLVSQPPEYLSSKDRLDPTALLHRSYNLLMDVEPPRKCHITGDECAGR